MNYDASIINIKVDPQLKRDAESLFADLGIPLDVAITIFLQAALENDGIPFEVKLRTPNPNTRAALAEYSAMQERPDLYRRQPSVDKVVDEALEDMLRSETVPPEQ